MMGLASVYRKYSLQGEGGREASKQISWIKDKLLHIYYQNSIDDRFEKLFSLCFHWSYCFTVQTVVLFTVYPRIVPHHSKSFTTVRQQHEINIDEIWCFNTHSCHRASRCFSIIRATKQHAGLSLSSLRAGNVRDLLFVLLCMTQGAFGCRNTVLEYHVETKQLH